MKRNSEKHNKYRIAPPNTYQGSIGKFSGANSFLNQIRPDTGWQVTTPDRDPAKNDTWNMMISDPLNQKVYLWVHEINIDFSMSGSVGQSRYRRQFFPKSFNQPVMNVKGQCANQYQYNVLSSFMRESHYQSLKNSGSPTVQILLKGAGKRGKNKQRSIKGGHKGLIFQGYLNNFDAGAMKFNYAPEFSFDVILATSVLTGDIGIYSDVSNTGSQTVGWMSMFKE